MHRRLGEIEETERLLEIGRLGDNRNRGQEFQFTLLKIHAIMIILCPSREPSQ